MPTLLRTISLTVLCALCWPSPGDVCPDWPAAPSSPRPDLPQLMLWAWERPEDLAFIDPGEAGVAYLAGRIELSGSRVATHPRLQRLSLPEGVQVESVVRIETNLASPADFSDKRLDQVVEAILWLVPAERVRHLQIDFDARSSEREGYRRLLLRIRERWPPPRTLAVTALASWCLGDPWIDRLPVDEAIPMLFQMGPEGPAIRRRLAGGGGFSSPLARHSAGFSTDELSDAGVRPKGRFYFFHPRAWTREAYRSVLKWRDEPR